MIAVGEEDEGGGCEMMGICSECWYMTTRGKLKPKVFNFEIVNKDECECCKTHGIIVVEV